jgi:hypothetical protein
VNVARSLGLSQQDGVSRPADSKSRSEIQGSKFPFAGGFSFLGQASDMWLSFVWRRICFPLTEDDLHALTEVALAVKFPPFVTGLRSSPGNMACDFVPAMGG